MNDIPKRVWVTIETVDGTGTLVNLDPLKFNLEEYEADHPGDVAQGTQEAPLDPDGSKDTPKRVFITMEQEDGQARVIHLDPSDIHMEQSRDIYRTKDGQELVPSPDTDFWLTGHEPVPPRKVKRVGVRGVRLVDMEKRVAFLNRLPELERVPGNPQDEVSKWRAKEVGKMVEEARRALPRLDRNPPEEKSFSNLSSLLREVGEARQRAKDGEQNVHISDNPKTRCVGFLIEDKNLLALANLFVLKSSPDVTEDVAAMFGKTPGEIRMMMTTPEGRGELAGESPEASLTDTEQNDTTLSDIWTEEAKLDGPLDDGELNIPAPERKENRLLPGWGAPRIKFDLVKDQSESD